MVKQYKGKINILKSDLKSFVQVWSKKFIWNSKITYLNVPDLKDGLLVWLVDTCNHVVKYRVHNERPILPQ